MSVKGINMEETTEEQPITIFGILKTSGEIDGGNYIKVSVDNHSKFGRGRELYIPAEGENLRKAGNLVGKRVCIFILEDFDEEEEEESTDSLLETEDNKKEIEEWDLGHE